MNTHLSQTVDITADKSRYDASVKEILADKQIAARILKYSLEEFADCEIDDIIKEMDQPQVSKVRMEPGQIMRIPSIGYASGRKMFLEKKQNCIIWTK